MKFYDCAPAPSPRRVRIFIGEKGMEIPTVEVDLRAHEQHGDAFATSQPSPHGPRAGAGRRTPHHQHRRNLRLPGSAPGPARAARGDAAREGAHRRDGVAHGDAGNDGGGRGPAQSGQGLQGGVRSRARPDSSRYPSSPSAACAASISTSRSSIRSWRIAPSWPASAFPSPTSPRSSASTFAGWVKKRLPEQAVHARRWYESVNARPSARL